MQKNKWPETIIQIATTKQTRRNINLSTWGTGSGGGGGGGGGGGATMTSNCFTGVLTALTVGSKRFREFKTFNDFNKPWTCWWIDSSSLENEI